MGQKPHLLVGTVVGTLAAYVAFFRHYTALADDSETWVWFGIRSDGRCGRDFAHEGTSFLNAGGDTMCGRGQCCSSHGWCGHGEEYCSVSMGCQSNCWAASDADKAKRDADDRDREHAHDPDDDEYADRMHKYRYDDDGDSDYYHRRGYGGKYRDHHHGEYHHRYDANDANDEDMHGHGEMPEHEDMHGQHDDPSAGHHHHGHDDHDPSADVEHYGGDHYGDEHGHAERDADTRYDSEDPHADPHGGHHRDHHGDHAEEGGAEPGAAEEAEKGPELVGLEEARHLGHGDGVPLHGEAPDPAA